MPIYSLVLLLGLLILSACTSTATRESRMAYAQRVCAATTASAAIRDEFMRQCVAMELGGPGPALYAPMNLPPSPQPSPYNTPNAFGPMGVWGPTWQEFNGAYQQQSQLPPPPPLRNRALDYMH